MAVMIQIRNVPDAVHKKLRARADAAGLSLSDYLLGELRRVLERPTRAELLARIAQRERVETQPASAEAVRAERDAR